MNLVEIGLHNNLLEDSMGWDIDRINGFWVGSDEYVETEISDDVEEDTMLLTVNSVDGRSTITLDCIGVEELIGKLQEFMCGKN